MNGFGLLKRCSVENKVVCLTRVRIAGVQTKARSELRFKMKKSYAMHGCSTDLAVFTVKLVFIGLLII